ncbi:MAG: hydantoinase B/oxoprolinase family protein, partial [Gammaproteobacteria bacterium]
VSHQVSPLMKFVGRGDTTVVDAYLSPLLKRYVRQVSDGLHVRDGKPKLMFMQSNGGLTEADRFQGRDCILSGPAGGIVGAAATSRMAGLHKVIAFDMGGTSTDVAHYDGEFERSYESEIAGVRMKAAMMTIHTVAAGGGSILHFDGMRFRVGPDSAGADPGPASYRRGGPLTVTDANLMLGKLPLFPKVFGENADQSLDEERVRTLFGQLAETVRAANGGEKTPEQVAEGFLAVAVENMADAIKKISVQRGYDVSEYTLCCYGAAGGQHACKVADRLGMRQVFLHPFAGVLSAYGMGLADLRSIRDLALERSWEDIDEGELRAIFGRLDKEGRDEMAGQGVERGRIAAVKKLHVRYLGTDSALLIDFADKPRMLKDFQEKHRSRFGFIYPDKPLIVESAVVEVIGAGESPEDPVLPVIAATNPEPVMLTCLFSGGRRHSAPVYERRNLRPGAVVDGPAVIIEPISTTIIEPGWRGRITSRNHLFLDRVSEKPESRAIGTRVDPVMLEIFNRLFMSIAEQMGFVLQNTAYSVNIKERLDFSCAVFDGEARLIANAPHIPVHLGSMGESVNALLASEADNMSPGDVYLTNSPYHGGTHLPDMTVVTPVFDQNGALLFFVGSRGHHADIGGKTPGSMPPDSRSIEEEGLFVACLKLVSGGKFQESTLRNWLASGSFPARNPEQNIADLKAQIAANEKGRLELQRMVGHYSLETVKAYMRHVQDNAEESVRRVIDSLKDGSFVYAMDEGAEIAVSIKVDRRGRRATVDFTGTSRQLESNFNAPEAVCKAAVLYVFRTLVQDDIPLNAGCLRPLNIVIPKGSMLSPVFPAAVVAGNVETSQYIVDALYGALGVMAGSQGTMNNFTFGDERYQYYETICGGAGAGADFDGCSAVQTHMTNSRLTDPELLEWRFPVMVDEFSIRRGSGGAGVRNGGDGVVRRIRFLEPMTVGILSSHRLHPPFGLQGGAPGKPGENRLDKASGSVIPLAGCATFKVKTDDTVVIETPGGGGFGRRFV